MRILILGGYGFFGTLLVKRLVRNPQYDVIIAGRQIEKAQQLVTALFNCEAKISSAAIDAANSKELFKALKSLAPKVVVNTCGPFQSQDYSVAKVCIEAGCHYIDFADGRDFVAKIDQLHENAVRKNVLVISGASSVPALSSAVVDSLSNEFAALKHIEIGISPGNKTDRGLATVAGILSYCGGPISIWRNGKPENVYGWLGAIRHRYPDPIGNRWLSDCDVPDLELFPRRYPSVDSVRFRAGLELPVLHSGMVLMSLLRRIGCIANWSRYALELKNASEWFRRFGSDHGGMHVQLSGLNSEGSLKRIVWTLVATNGDGPFVPVLASAAIIQKMSRGGLCLSGAMPCMGIVSLDEILQEADGLNISAKLDTATL